MNNTERTKKLCSDAASGKISPKVFYDSLSEIAAAEDEDSDLACLLEDAVMELEMDGSAANAKAAAESITEELNGHF